METRIERISGFEEQGGRFIKIRGDIKISLIVYAILCVPISLGNDAQLDSAAAWNENGTSLYNQGKYSEALHAFDNALEYTSSSPQIWYNKGNALYSQGRYDESLEAYDRVLELDSQYAYAWLAKGKALYYLMKYEEAVQALDEVLELNPQDSEALSTKNKALDALSLTANQPPKLDGLNPDHPSPQDGGTEIVWTASAIDPDGDPILYMFLLNGKPATDWNIGNTWTWSTSEEDEGESKIEVRVRDGMHASSEGSDDDMSESFLINKLEARSNVVALGGSKRHSYVPGPAFTDRKPPYIP